MSFFRLCQQRLGDRQKAGGDLLGCAGAFPRQPPPHRLHKGGGDVLHLIVPRQVGIEALAVHRLHQAAHLPAEIIEEQAVVFQAQPLTVEDHFIAFDSYVLDIVAASHISAEGLALQRMDTIFKRDKSFTVGDIKSVGGCCQKNTFILLCDECGAHDQGSAFYVPSVGLITSYHVVENEGFFKVYTAQRYPSNHETVVGLFNNIEFI